MQQAVTNVQSVLVLSHAAPLCLSAEHVARAVLRVAVGTTLRVKRGHLWGRMLRA